jgi:DNA-binding MarR family transcriptional regulator
MRIEDEIKQPVFKDIYHKAYLNIIYTAGWLELRQAESFKPYGLTLPQFNILRILRGQHPKPATVNLLIERMLDKTSNASRIVDKLVAKNLVCRSQCEHDRRTVDVVITQAGLDILAQIDKDNKTSQNGFTNITAAEAEVLNQILDKIRG